MPCTSPPWTWPWTIIGLSWFPQSSTASSRWAASVLAVSTTLSQVLARQQPSTARDREPPVMLPNGTSMVSLARTSMSSIGTPSLSATIWHHDVSWPWPWGWLPVVTRTLLVGSSLTVLDPDMENLAPPAAISLEGA